MMPHSPPESKSPEILTAAAAAELLGVSLQTIYAEVRRGRLPHFHVGRLLRFRRAELLALGERKGRGR
jgi:excisionase family DNA binding protein